MALTPLKAPFNKSQFEDIKNYVGNKIKTELSGGVYLLKVNGDIIRYDLDSNTPIQDAINDAELSGSAGLSDLVIINNYQNAPISGGGNGKQEQNITLRNDVNIYFIGSKLFSNNTADVPLFTDNGVQVQVFFMGYCNLVRYGGAGVNNRNVIKLTNTQSQLFVTEAIVFDSSSGSTYAIDCAGNIDIVTIPASAGSIRLTNGSLNISHAYTPQTIVQTGGNLMMDNVTVTLTQSGGTSSIKGNVTLTLNGGDSNISDGNNILTINSGNINIKNSSLCELQASGGSVNIFSSILSVLENDGATIQVNNCIIDDATISLLSGNTYLNYCRIQSNSTPSALIEKEGGTLVLNNSILVGGAECISASTPQTIVSYNSFAKAPLDSNVTVSYGTLTVNTSVI